MSNKKQDLQKYYCRNSPKSSRKIVEKGKIDTIKTQIHDHSLSQDWYKHFNKNWRGQPKPKQIDRYVSVKDFV